MTTPQTTHVPPTVWGLDAPTLHARFWASRGVQVVTRGESTELVPHAELYLLTEPGVFSVFRPSQVLDVIAWLDPELTVLRLIDVRDRGYVEHLESDSDGRFVRFRRVYGRRDSLTIRIGLTVHRELAVAWQLASCRADGWKRLRRLASRDRRYAASVPARVYFADASGEVVEFVRELASEWTRPDATIHRIQRVSEGVWADDDATVSPEARFVGPIWIGAGRSVTDGVSAVGPAVMWDEPQARPTSEAIPWLDLELLPAEDDSRPRPIRRRGLLGRTAKRAFDIVFSVAALAVTLPFYPLIAAAIVLESGLPVFFRHRRETLGGRVFACIKFRSMRPDADGLQHQLAARNEVDGPQFFIREDPRLTRVGALMRKLQIDEWPQFINVLAGDMSVVGPRPSPFKENQYCPPWREARLSVRPGITGLWQISRTRRVGADFQEWIRFDLEYVERQSLWLDLKIIARTIVVVLRELVP